MATALAARRLAQAHRLAQLRVAHDTIRTMSAVWSLLDPSDVDRTFNRWFDAVLPAINGYRTTSARIAGRYLETSKHFALGESATVAPVLALEVSQQAAATSLLVTGPLSIKRAMTRGVALAQAVNTAEGASAASAVRFALDGGRETILDTLKTDEQARGWSRVTSGNACDFCSMLEGRGAVYSADTADFQAHDGCSCGAEAVWG
jgi:hypothetical protein